MQVAENCVQSVSRAADLRSNERCLNRRCVHTRSDIVRTLIVQRIVVGLVVVRPSDPRTLRESSRGTNAAPNDQRIGRTDALEKLD